MEPHLTSCGFTPLRLLGATLGRGARTRARGMSGKLRNPKGYCDLYNCCEEESSFGYSNHLPVVRFVAGFPLGRTLL